MRYEILGPLRINTDDREVQIRAARERALFATLLLHADRPVTTEQLIDTIWGTQPPRNARNQLQGSVFRLRKQLADAGIGGRPIVTEPSGYRAAVDPSDVDLVVFRQQVAKARGHAAAGRNEEARSAYRAALGLWRGPVFAGIASDLVQHTAAVLEEERLQAHEECLEVELAAGEHGGLIAELTDLVQQHPYRERLYRAMMLALYRAGRQADALAAFRNVRRLLRDELGTEPGEDLRRLNQAILHRDPSLELAARPAPTRPAIPVPRELPGDVAGFTGRAEALDALDRLVSGGSRASGPVVISALAGTAGVGKTALAVHWAHRAAHRFPDGQLFVNLRGYDPEQPLTPDEALARFLGSLGVAGQEIPAERDERAARYRTEVAGRRLLILLDNAASVEQVRPLLPGSGACLVIVTSRDSLAGLVALHGAHRLDLDVLSPAEAVALLRRLIGPRVDAEPDAAARLAEQCARLPLALRVAAQLVVARPSVPLADLVVELGDQQHRLDLLAADDDPRAAVETVFSWSIRQLPPDVARAFRLLGLHPGPDFDAYAVAALADVGLERAHQLVELLSRAHLAHPTGPGRHGMHDLLRAYAARLAATAEPDRQRHAALTRLFDYHLAAAAAAMDSWHPSVGHLRPRVPACVTPMPDFADPDTARRWLDTELPCLVAMAVHTASHGWPRHTVQLSGTLQHYLQGGGHYTDALTISHHAYQAAEQLGDVGEQARALRYLGIAQLQMGRPNRATDQFQRALAMFRQAGDRAGEATAHNNLGLLEERLGRNQAAADHYRRGLALFREVGEPAGEANTLNGLGVIEERLGRYRSAAEHYQQAMAMFRQLGNELGEAIALHNLGNVEGRLGNDVVAADHQERALEAFQAIGNPQGEAHTLESLAGIDLRAGRPEQAIEHAERALAIFRDIADDDGEAQALNRLGQAARALGDTAAALAHHRDALAIGTEADLRDVQARAHTGLADTYRAIGDIGLARSHYEQALTLYNELGMPEASDAKAHLATLG